MKYIYSLLFMIACCFITNACTDTDDNEISIPLFEMSEEDLLQQFTKDKNTHHIPVNTTLDSDQWSVKSDEEWCLAARSINGKGITLSILSSDESEVRTAKIEVKSPINNYTIIIEQLGYGPAILLKTQPSEFTADGGEMMVVVTANVPYKAEIGANGWLQEVEANETRGFIEHSHHYTALANQTFRSRTTKLIFSDSRTVSDLAKDVEVKITQAGKEGNISDVPSKNDIKIQPTSGKASEHQPGQGIENSFDGKIGAGSSPYHSLWSQSAKFPVILEYFFEGNQEEMDYIVYHARNGNGNFGAFDLYISTQEQPEYTLFGEYDFKFKNGASRILFPASIKNITAVKFSIKSGAGNFVSCDEMEFFRKNTDTTLDNLLLTVFTDLTCSELRNGVTDGDFNSLPSFFGKLANTLAINGYSDFEKEFRIQAYNPYSDVEEWATKLMTKRYSNLDNPAGIYVNAGDSIVVLVGNTNGQTVSLQCIGERFGEYYQVNSSGDMYFLEEGVNKIGIRNSGDLFIMYNTNLASATAQPITIHIPQGCGTVNGYFDLNKHKTDEKYADLLNKSTYKYFCVRGDKMMFYFHRKRLKEFVPNGILSAIHLWDDIVGWQQELMGIDDVRPSQVNNHMMAISPEGGYMWASDYQVGFVDSYLNNILLKENVMAAKDNAWGPGHEIGHIHQQAINWPSSTESSNNLFSNYVLYRLGKYCSRGAELKEVAKARFEDGQGWWNMGDATHQNESTEIHMRMNWQLWNYYHRCGYNPQFWQTLFKLLRQNRIVESDPGAGQLQFAKMASRAANENLTDFFELWGFFVPVNNQTYSQYGTWNYNVTAKMIADAKAYMAQFPAPKHAFQYIEDRKQGDTGLDTTPSDLGYYTQFKDNVKITSNITYSISGQTISITNGSQAVAYEMFRDGKMVYFSNMLSFELPASIPADKVTIYAVQADGKRQQIKKG